MPALHEIQRDMRKAIAAGGGAPDAIQSDGVAAEARLAIYRNHYRISLAEALTANFPVIARLVGERCFSGLARAFASESPPETPCLAEYGAGFSAFLDRAPGLGGTPYLGDVARLEWAIVEAHNAPDLPSIDPRTLARVAPDRQAALRLVFHPAAQLLASPYPVARIWTANQEDADGAPVDLREGRCRLLVHRHADDVVWTALGEGAFIFLYALFTGHSIERAFEAATQLAPRESVNPAQLIAGLLESDAVVGALLPQLQPQG